MKIAVTGATGFIGSHLSEALVARGHEVTCLARGPEKTKWIAHLPVRIHYGDVSKPETLPDFAAGQDVIVHAAGITKGVDLDEYLQVNVGGTENLLNAIKARNTALKRFIYISSQEAMGPCPDGVPMAEDHERNPLSMYGKSKHFAEKILNRYRDSISMSIIRPPTVYGPRDRDVYAYFRLAARGITPVVGYSNTVSMAYVKNLVSGITLAIERPLGSFRSYFFTDGAPLTWTEVAELIANALGKRTVRIRIPSLCMRMAGGISGFYTSLTNKAVLLSRDKIEAMKNPYWIVSDERARSELGYRPAYTTEQGIRETALWYKSENWL
jgi:nucleoside-diphosphate-sugar epimerase